MTTELNPRMTCDATGMDIRRRDPPGSVVGRARAVEEGGFRLSGPIASFGGGPYVLGRDRLPCLRPLGFGHAEDGLSVRGQSRARDPHDSERPSPVAVDADPAPPPVALPIGTGMDITGVDGWEVASMPGGTIERQGVSPYLSRYAERRTGPDRLPGRYCDERQMWLVDTDQGPRALIDTGEGRAATETVTRVLAEQTDSSLAARTTGTQPVTTVTAVAMEQDDWVADRTALHRLATITEVAAEQTDK